MKTFMLFLLCALTTSTIFSQTQKGKIMLGASTNLNLVGYGSGAEVFSLGFTSSKSNGSEATKQISVNLFPKVGYFIINNLAVGLDVNIAFANVKYGDEELKANSSLLGAGPFVRYYMSSGKVKPFLEVNSMFGSSKTVFEDEDGDDEYKTSITSFGGGLGVALPLGDKFCFDVLLGYNNYNLKDKSEGVFSSSDQKINSIGVKLGFTVFLGGGATE